MVEFCRYRIKLGRDRNRRRTKISQVKHVATKISMSQQTARQAKRIREENYVATKEFPIATEIAKDSNKSCRDRVDRLKRKMMSRQTLEAEGHEKLVTNKFSVTTQYISVATKTRLVHQNYVATLSKSIMTESKKELKEQVATKDCMLRQRSTTKTGNSVAT